MPTTKSMINGTGHHQDRTLEKGVLPQAEDLLADVESLVRNEARLVEARFLNLVTNLEVKLIRTIFGVVSLLLALGLFVISIFYVLHESFPAMRVSTITGILAATVCILGILLITKNSYFPKASTKGTLHD
jgi:hypothetical protein